MIARVYRSRPFLLQTYLALAILENFAALFYLASIPSDAKNALILGYSPIRLTMFGGMGITFLIFCTMSIRLLVSRQGMEKALKAVSRALDNTAIYYGLVYASALTVVCGIVVLLLPAERLKGAVYTVERLIPVILWLMALSLQTLIGQYIWRGEKFSWKNLTGCARIFRISLIVFACFLTMAGWVLWSRIGLDPDRSGWYSPGTPVLFSQVILCWIIGMSLIFWEKPIGQLLSSLKYKKVRLTLDLALSTLLWLTAGLVWWMQPMSRWGYFTSAPTAPNFEAYPYSDAAIYDEASQGLLIGISRSSGVMLRPLYTFFLALLHTLGGQVYGTVVLYQIFALAMIPVLVYLIGSRLSNRPAGLIAALLIVLREKNSIALTNILEVSHTKLLLSDFPAMALMLLFVYVVIVWLQVPNRQGHHGVFAGATLGLVVLVRSQAQLLIPVVMIIIILVERFHWRTIIQRSALFLVGLIVVIAPWVGRNYLISGRAAVENPEFYIRILASGYVHSQDGIEMLAGESFDEYYDRMVDQIGRFVMDHPAEVARFYGGHFMHNEIGSVIYLPLTPRLPSLYSYVREFVFWKEPTRILSGGPLVMLFLNLAVISVGIATAFWRARWVGLIPLLIHLGYSLSVVPMRLSGWRFILPVDWASLLYYSIGLMMLGVMIRSGFVKTGQDMAPGNDTKISAADSAPQHDLRPGHKMISRAVIISALLGLSLPFFEILTPVRYLQLSHDQIVREYVSGEISLSDGGSLAHSDLVSFLKTQNGSAIVYGRALYPGYYEMGEFWGDQNATLMAASAYNRLQFKLIGPTQGFVFIPLSESPESFPHAAEVIVIGCSSQHGIKALLIKIEGRPDWLMASPWPGLQCSEFE